MDWLFNLPVVWMSLVVFGGTYVAAGVIYWIVKALAVGERARAFKGVSPGLLSPLGVIFGLFVAFVAVQVWSNADHAKAAVSSEASALRAAILLADTFPGEVRTRLHNLVRRHITETVNQEWPMMARHRATLTISSPALVEALQVALALTPSGQGQSVAQREMVAALERALDGRRQRVMISHSGVDWVKCIGLLLQAACTLLTIAMVHSDNRHAGALAMGIFATGVAISLILIASHARPFTGELAVGPQVLLEVMPK